MIMKLEDGGNKRQPSLDGARESHTENVIFTVVSISLSCLWRTMISGREDSQLQPLHYIASLEDLNLCVSS